MLPDLLLPRDLSLTLDGPRLRDLVRLRDAGFVVDDPVIDRLLDFFLLSDNASPGSGCN